MKEDRPSGLRFRFNRDVKDAEKEVDDLVRMLPYDAVAEVKKTKTKVYGEHMLIVIRLPIGDYFSESDVET